MTESDHYRELSKQIEFEWDKDEAAYVYVLTHTVKFRGQCQVTSGVFKIRTRTEYGDWREITSEIGRGNRSWAERTAAHYGLTLPSEVSH